MKLIIGFATQYYTLWEYEAVTTYKTDSYGNHHACGIDHKYHYVKNISTDLSKVESLYPNVSIDMSIRGNASFIRNEILNLPNNYFWAGKYAGRLIDEIIEIDFNYCLWSCRNYNMPYILNHPKYIAHLAAIEADKMAKINNAQTVKVGDCIELEFLSNGFNPINNYNQCTVNAQLGDTVIRVLCGGVKLVNGLYPYLMPLINGKFQRVKGKFIKVEVVEVIETTLNDYDGIVTQTIRVA